jgi:Caspase domain
MIAESARHALILAVPENGIDNKLNLPVVRKDSDLLARALRESSYDVMVRGVDAPHEVSKNLIGAEIRQACERVPEDGTLLIFFSGHGLHSGGHDYLFPWDADLRGSHDSTLFRVGDVSEWVDDSRARQIVFFIDACREGFEQGKRPLAASNGAPKNVAARKNGNTQSCSPASRGNIRIMSLNSACFRARCRKSCQLIIRHAR